jgi:hypothetical protein
MNVVIGTEAAQLLFWEYINLIFGTAAICTDLISKTFVWLQIYEKWLQAEPAGAYSSATRGIFASYPMHEQVSRLFCYCLSAKCMLNLVEVSHFSIVLT